MDKYSRNARIYPMIILLLPIVLLGLIYSWEYQSILQALTTLGVTAALTYLFANLGRDLGKKKEAELWEKWGGMPSAQLFSFQNNVIDRFTKQKYHSKMLQLSPVSKEYNFEKDEYKALEDVYISWTKFLISKTRDTKKYALLFNELISYGFRRNLWGLKKLSLISLTILIISNYLFQSFKMGVNEFIDFPVEFFITELILALLYFIWVFVFTTEWVKIPAVAYAERLLESIETF